MSFGSYEQDNNLTNGKEPIQWRVLEVKNGKALVISEYGLDLNPDNFYEEKETYYWRDSELRSWLDRDFYENAFSEAEQDRIIFGIMEPDTNPQYGTDWVYETRDRVFLLSATEVLHYFSTNASRQCVPTEYAKARANIVSTEFYGGGLNIFSEENNACKWWLRTPGRSNYEAATVNFDGSINYLGSMVSIDGKAIVRPAMWVQISADPQMITSKTEIGDIVSFGHYEQDNNLSNGKEAISWEVLDVKDGKAMLISQKVIDVKKYNDTRSAITWENSSLRSWLNGTFLTEAFSTDEQAKIVKSLVTADPYQPSKYYPGVADPGNDTEDKVFLLSATEAAEYLGTNKKSKSTEYAKAQGVSMWANNIVSRIWLRTPATDADSVSFIGCRNEQGTFTIYYNTSNFVDSDDVGLRPVLWVNLV